MVTASRARAACLPLESGDRLTRAEFERRYLTRPDIKRAELIEGVVYVSSPVRLDEHAEPHADVIYWLNHYRVRHPGLRIADNGTVRFDDANEVQPDAMLFRSGEAARASVDSDGYVIGSPELVVEVAASTASNDLGAKMDLYRRAGVQEYVVWQILEARIDWWQLIDGEYRPLAADTRGVTSSFVFPGLAMDVAAMIVGDLKSAVGPIGS